MNAYLVCYNSFEAICEETTVDLSKLKSQEEGLVALCRMTGEPNLQNHESDLTMYKTM